HDPRHASVSRAVATGSRRPARVPDFRHPPSRVGRPDVSVQPSRPARHRCAAGVSSGRAVRMHAPVSATYRLQLHPGFTFDDAARVAPYLAALGVSHVYCSPYLQAAPGSTHGYDVIDHTRVNRELGGEAGFDRFVAAL